MLPSVMNTNAFPLSLAALLLLIPACGEPAKVENTEAPVPKPDEVYRKELLAGPAEDARKASRALKDFPDLKITADAASKPEGEEVLDYWEEGMFHLVITLASGKQVRNTHKAGGAESMWMIDGVQIPGLVWGCLGMKKGEVRNLLIPADYAFAEHGDARVGIGPNATLLVRAELVEFGAPMDPDFHIKRSKAGTGPVIRNSEFGRFHYTGVLADGDKKGLVFDSSMRPGREPLRVQVGPAGGVIEGWKQGLVSMQAGERRWLKIPPHLAYGSSGQGDIPADATLIFEVELVSIEAAPAFAPPPMGSPNLPPGLSGPNLKLSNPGEGR